MNANPADLAVIDANVWSAPGETRAEAVAIRDGRILAVGSTHAIEEWIAPSTTIIEGRGRFVAPGFIDSHVHFLEGGFQLSSVQLQDCASEEKFVEAIRRFAETLQPDEWILGGNWNHYLWGGEMPRRDWIDAVTPRNPVWIDRHDGHMALANTLAIERAGLAANVAEIDGGEIERNPDGSLTGVFKDNAMILIQRVLPKPTTEQSGKALQAAMQHVAAQGVTSIHHMGSWDDLAVFKKSHTTGDLKTRIYAAVPISTWEPLRDEVEANGRGDEWLRIGALKGFLDGSLGSKTAQFFEPYLDDPDNDGLLVESPQELYEKIQPADKAGLHVLMHAIGDRANHEILNVFERVIEANGPRDRRFRIEHAQHLRPDDIARFHTLNVIASMQPYHLMDDGCWAEAAIGAKRSSVTYAFRSLLDAQARLAFGSDWFVAPPTPLEGIYAAVSRRTKDGNHPDGWTPLQKITAEESLQAYTTDAAYASFEEEQKGALKPGMYADLVIIDHDIAEISSDEIAKAHVDLTLVNGDIVFENNAE
ncbi:MAG: amidohydrolase [Candidatus Hinthialibacter antarcticus]|nr:amidohydrolase [Candidatus Hinthialibacter antarcticus]